MNALDVMKYGHQTVLRAVDALPEEAWEMSNVVGRWSTKNIIAHLASFEHVLLEVLTTFLDASQPTPTLEQFTTIPAFNDEQVAARQTQNYKETLAEYYLLHDKVMTVAKQLPAETFQQTGLIPWYGSEYALDDLIVYMFYGHKREHCAQIALFRKRLE
jgi:hypothetical protein